MNNIKIRTFWQANNYGAVLQAFALKTYLEKQGKIVEMDLYQPQFLKEKLFISKYKNHIKNIIYNMITLFRRLIRKKKFSQFISNYLKNNFSNTEIDKFINIVGSDQVWNNDITSDDLHYFYNDISEEPIYSYAASFGNKTVNATEEQIVLLKKFNKIGVREFNGVEFLQKKGFDNVRITIDPVFLLDRDFYLNLIENHKTKRIKKFEEIEYILIYTLETNSEVLNRISDINGKRIKPLKTVSIGSFRNIYGTDFHYSDLSPEEFLFLIKNALYVLTNSFHCIAFSVIFQNGFNYIQLSNDRGARVENLLKIFNLDTDSLEYYMESIDYEDNEIVRQSKIYLKDIINENKLEIDEYK